MTKYELIDACNACIVFSSYCIKACNECSTKCQDNSPCPLIEDVIVAIQECMEFSKNCVDECHRTLDQKSSNPEEIEAINRTIKEASESLKNCKAALDKISNKNYQEGCIWPLESCNKSIQACDALIEILER